MAQNTDNPSKQEKPKFMRPSNDIVFKLLFADERNVSFLKSFLLSILDFPKEEYDTISIIDPHLLREHFDDKLGILDVKLKTSTGKIINIEVQVKSLDIMRERIAFYSSKLIIEQIGKGDEYAIIKPVVQITIAADFVMIPESQKYCHRFSFYDPNAEVQLSDIMTIYTLELPKLPSNYDGTMMWNWLKFLGARNEEELKMASEANPEIEKAAVRLEQLSADESARMLYEAREKELRDTRAAIRKASEKSLAVGKAEGLAEGEKKLLSVALKTLEHWYANRRYH